jgi:signal transduction histidine kinase
MSALHMTRFHHIPVRVAAATTAVVAALYVAVAVAVTSIVAQNLVQNIDSRLDQRLAAIEARPEVLSGLTGRAVEDLDNDGDARRFDAPLLVWLRGPGNALYQSDATAALPADLQAATGPATATIGGAEMRVVGGPLDTPFGPGWITIAQTMAEATNARNTLVLAELLIAPGLLLVVFVGALAVGRRVAGPIEQARLGQLAFTADASHELRTPLSVIEAESSLALGSARDPTADGQTFERIHEETRHLHRLVDDLLWLARFDSAPAPPDAVPVDVGALATTTSERFHAICDQRGMRLTTHVTGTLSPIITAPPEWIARLLSVLLDNAVRHSPPGAAVTVTVGGEAGRVHLTVEDTGPGILPEQRARIFDRFHRASDAPDGAGLGLAIADAVVRATAGHWEIGDADGGGARMSVWWPRSQGRGFNHPSPEQAAEVSAQP